MMKKILFIIPNLQNVGPVNMCLSLIKNLDDKFFEVYVYALGSGIHHEEFAHYANVRVFNRRNIFTLFKQLNKSNFDIIHSHCIISDLILFFSCASGVRITTIHNYPDIDSIYRRGQLIGSFLAFIQCISIKKIVKVACSDSVKKYCEIKLGMKDVYSIPNGVEQKKVSCKIINQDSLYNDQINFFYLGSLTIRKNVELVLDAFHMWSDEKNAQLHIIGTGDQEKYLREKFTNKKIIFHGLVSKPIDVIYYYDCFVSASNAEGMPLALLEAMSIGKAFICSDISPHVEVFEKTNNSGGVIFSLEDDAYSLMTAFTKYYEIKDKSKLSSLNQETYYSYYTDKKMATNYMQLYLYFFN
ncbi:MAG: glycosyltransferase family 4 protein [Candidatus Malihini olakiniferum]